jgi:predicted Rossmann-fold nucleotide-binding protein
MGSEFWDHLREFVRTTLVGEGAIDPSDLELMRSANTPEEAVRLIREGMGSV